MEIMKYDPSGLLTKIVRSVYAAKDARELLYGVELSPAEYAELKAELGVPETDVLAVVPYVGLPIYVDGADMRAEFWKREIAIAQDDCDFDLPDCDDIVLN